MSSIIDIDIYIIYNYLRAHILTNYTHYIIKGYDLSQADEQKAFVDDFKCQKAISILKELYEKISNQTKGPELISIDNYDTCLSARGTSLVYSSSSSSSSSSDNNHNHKNKIEVVSPTTKSETADTNNNNNNNEDEDEDINNEKTNNININPEVTTIPTAIPKVLQYKTDGPFQTIEVNTG